MDNSSTPLADYFWIAGVESISYADGPSVSHLEDTIAEDGEPEPGHRTTGVGLGSGLGASCSACHSRQSSGSRLSRLSFSTEPRGTIEDGEGNTRSNRSSATIRAALASGSGGVGAGAGGDGGSTNTGAAGQGLRAGVSGGSGGGGRGDALADLEFDKALMKFVVERDNFLDDLTFSAGAKVQARPPMVNPRTEKLKAEDSDTAGRRSPLRSIRGSIRRKISFRDMSSMRKQAMGSRAGSVRTAKRLSNYNSVIPPPEPLNMDPDMHPLKRRFEPTLLDRYPPRDAPAEEVARRGKFPDYVPMFAFPNDIQIVSSDDRPRSTWHGFTMTSDDSSKIYGITLILWVALTSEVAEEVEKRCEQWRQSHMTNEERELAASLGVRLAAERAHLSQLLARLPTVPSGSAAREALDEQISAVEEKIGLMTEMLRPLRHGAASKIDGLTAGETGLWVPRAFGILGRDATKMGFWKEWLRAVVVPMNDGAILRVPSSSPKVGRWQPLERYVVNLCTEAFSPLSSKTQVELGVRELRLYARTEAVNELPGARSGDLYALMRCLSLEHLVLLFEYAMSESRIIFAASHTGMLHLACHALVSLLYPLRWASIFIPVLPARLISALDAPCPYIVGIEKRYERVDLPEDDYVLVDLDRDTVDATARPPSLPRQPRRKLLTLLQVAAPHRLRYGVTPGPPPYAVEAFPYDAFSAENEAIFNPRAAPSQLGKWVSQNSSTFSEHNLPGTMRPPIFNVFSQTRGGGGGSSSGWTSSPGAMIGGDQPRPTTAKSGRGSLPSSVSPVSLNFPPMPVTPVSRSDSGFAGSANHTVREKKSGHFDSKSRRSSSFGIERHGPIHRPSLPFLNGHSQNLSISATSVDSQSSCGGGYAPSTYAQSTIAASTMLPNMMVQPVRNTDTTVWVEGHCFERTPGESDSNCTLCEERSDGDGLYKCISCGCLSHGRCLSVVALVCPDAFHADRVRAAFVRCLASLLYTYRKHLGRPSKTQKENRQLYAFDMDGFIRSLPYEQQDYAAIMRQTQAFNEFIHERETKPPTDPIIRLFDEILIAKKARGRPAFSAGLSRLSTIRASHGLATAFSGPGKDSKSSTYLSDTSNHIWRTASVPVPSAKFPGDYRSVITRIPIKLDPLLIKEPRAIQGVPRPEHDRSKGLVRKQVPSIVGMPLNFTPPP